MTDTPDQDYKQSLFLPKTDFPMRAGLPKKEPGILDKWRENAKRVGKQLEALNWRAENHALFECHEEFIDPPSDPQKRPTFTLHDGPPYANGHLHIGHALNKILKDIVVRSKKMSGFDTHYVPGWDCHGLPIEWKIEEKYRKSGKNKDDVPINDFRSQCRDYAKEWVDIQSEEFQRLGIRGEWGNPYLTMHNKSEAIIANELLKFAQPNGGLYRSSKPVFWSCVEKTALADAETEYQDKESQAIWVKFPVQNGDDANLSVVIWTTTPWTIPANLAIAFGEHIEYGIYEVTAETPDENWVKQGEKFLLADTQAANVFKNARIPQDGYQRIKDAENLNNLICAHPLHRFGGAFAHQRRLICADFVTDDAGTGFVHIAPGHGEDDYGLWLNNRDCFPQEFAVDLPHTVRGDGGYYDHVPQFWKHTDKYADKDNIYILKPNGKEGNANDAVIETLKLVNCLAGHSRIKHSYPHSWRSKAPLIFRNTPQWFISMSQNDLRKTALSELEKVKFYPDNGRNRITSMIKARPDWVVSRQRAWGVPLALFVDRETQKIINDDVMNQRIIDIFTKQSADAWWQLPATDFFPEFDNEKHEQIFDILDVWFDSGSTHAFVLEERDNLQSPADLYLEGSDQHRGWFHSSLLQSCGTRGHAPYKALLTHGFVLDEKGEKMSKSKGNVVTPQEIIKDYGADILRLWVATSDYHDDLRIGKEILKGTADTYRRLRNAMRWMLGALEGFEKTEIISPKQMPPLEQWVLHRLTQVGADVKKYYDCYDFNRAFTSIFNFITNDLSAFYFDIRKDSLYCDDINAPNRRACRTTLHILTQTLSLWLAPIIPFTTDEIWGYLTQNNDDIIIHDYDFVFPNYIFTDNFDTITKARQVRRVVNGCLEKKRADKTIGASLEAKPVVYIEDKNILATIKSIDFADLCIVGEIAVTDTPPTNDIFTLDDVTGVVVGFDHADGNKCQRCWKILPEVLVETNNICKRCHDVMLQYKPTDQT
ncbi:MAG: isoleucyl-tRNA synthetase [Alphaproteobacteria bacterium]|jgi:isoleucyl-tRNA synthetase